MPHRKKYFKVLAMLLPVVLGACGLLGSDDNESALLDQINRAQAIWDSEGAATYAAQVIRGCECPVDGASVTIDVANDEIVGATYNESAEPVDPADWSRYATLNDLFTIARDAARQKVATLSINYHPDYLYISQLVIDYDATRTDDDFIYIVDDYAPAEPD